MEKKSNLGMARIQTILHAGIMVGMSHGALLGFTLSHFFGYAKELGLYMGIGGALLGTFGALGHIYSLTK